MDKTEESPGRRLFLRRQAASCQFSGCRSRAEWAVAHPALEYVLCCPGHLSDLFYAFRHTPVAVKEASADGGRWPAVMPYNPHYAVFHAAADRGPTGHMEMPPGSACCLPGCGRPAAYYAMHVYDSTEFVVCEEHKGLYDDEPQELHVQPIAIDPMHPCHQRQLWHSTAWGAEASSED